MDVIKVESEYLFLIFIKILNLFHNINAEIIFRDERLISCDHCSEDRCEMYM